MRFVPFDVEICLKTRKTLFTSPKESRGKMVSVSAALTPARCLAQHRSSAPHVSHTRGMLLVPCSLVMTHHLGMMVSDFGSVLPSVPDDTEGGGGGGPVS